MGFTLGGVDEAMDPQVLVGLAVDADGTVNGVTSWMPIFVPGGRNNRPAGPWTSCADCRADSATRWSSSSPRPASRSATADVASSPCPEHRWHVRIRTPPAGSHTPWTRSSSSSPRPLNRDYGFQSLHAFKTKFQPRFVPLHLTFPDEAALPRIGVALGRAYLPQAGLRDLVTLTRSGAPN